MKIALIGQDYMGGGQEMIAAMARREGHDLRFFPDPSLFDDGFFRNDLLAKVFDCRRKIVRNVVRFEPDVVAMSVMTDTYPWAHDIARRIKSIYPSPVVMGGDHASAAPHALIEDPYVDYVVQGEGEYPFIELLSRIEDGAEPDDVANVWFKQNGSIEHTPPRALYRDLDSLPFADKSIYDGTAMDVVKVYTIMGSRGCPYKCTYCTESMNKKVYSGEKGSYWRSRSPDNVIEELVLGKRKRRLDCVVFYDLLFGANIRWLREFAPKYRDKIGVPFSICSHPAHMTEEYVALLKGAGCFKVNMGVQTLNPEIRKTYLHRHETNEQIAKAIENAMKAGLILHAENIFNLPSQTDNDFYETIKFYNAHRPTHTKIFGLRLFPGTEMEAIVRGMGMAEKSFDNTNTSRLQTGRKAWHDGDWSSDKIAGYQVMASLVTLLPPNIVNYILEKRLYRFLPKGAAYLLDLFMRVLTSDKRETGRIIIAKRYKYYMVNKVKELFSGKVA